MKKNWKMIVGAVFLIGGFGCVGSDMGAAVLGVFVGVALIVWWCLGLKKVPTQNQTAAKDPSRLIDPPTAAKAPSRPIDPPAAVKESSCSIEPPARQFATQISPRPEKSKDGYDVVIPEKKDGVPLAYRYSVPFVPSSIDDVLAAAKEERWYLSAKQIDKKIHLFSEESDLGVLVERADMVSDWLRRGEPFLIVLKRVNSETECKVLLAFYRDKQKYYANREQTVTALTSFKAGAKQDVLSCLGESEELELEEDLEKEDVVTVAYMGDAIGRLPKKYALKYISDGAALVVLDHTEEDDEFILKPYVRIYW